MDIGFLSNVVYPFVKGGAEKRIYEIGRRLAAEGHDVTVYGRYYWDGPAVIDYEGMTYHAVAPASELYEDERRSISEAMSFAARALPDLRREATNHDVLDASQFPYFPVLAARLSTLGLDVPLVVTWHEVWGEYWREYLGALAPGGQLVEAVTANVDHHPVAVSRSTADDLDALRCQDDPIDVVPNGIDLDRIRDIEPADDAADVLYVGRLSEHKNVDLLIDAFESVAADTDAVMQVVGDGPERDRLEARAAASTASDRIEFLGFVDDHEDVLAYMRAADVFASPSTREGFGITYLEALAADCTVIAADHPDSAATDVLGDAAFAVTPSTSALVDVLERALQGAEPTGDADAVVEAHDWDAVATKALASYKAAR